MTGRILPDLRQNDGSADASGCRPLPSRELLLADGDPARVGKLRAYGNAICAKVAQTFIESYLEVRAAR